MILTLVGGGAHRLLQTVRSALKVNVFAAGGEIRLYDVDEHRAESMAMMILKSPELRKTPVPVKWKLTLPEALEGADVVSITLLAGGTRRMDIDRNIVLSHGFMGSDNISYSGAFLALRGIPIVLNIARNMEKYCPNAVLLEFANPVAVLTAAVRMTTKIKCYGICAGHENHGWDYNRILTGVDAYDPSFKVRVAGVNHLSFVVEGTIHGENLIEALLRREKECPDWAERINFDEKWKFRSDDITGGLKRIFNLLHNHGGLLFSTEGDGYNHFFHESKLRTLKKPECVPFPELLSKADMEELETRLAATAEKRRLEDERFDKFAAMGADDIPWNDPLDRLFAVTTGGDVTGSILKGLAGVTDCDVAISDFNCGSVTNVDPDFVLEYTHHVSSNGITRDSGLKIPMGVYGMTASIAAHQTLLARAAVEDSAVMLYQALRAYPIGSDTANAHEMWKKLLVSNRDAISPAFQRMPEYYEL